ncbi:MAG: hypothetical protein A2915_00980 [Candidatus Yanofskybacteria bacterium RIFCSPLOWO2_01_FULL_41_34]|nr:MAG: hypothetical protein A2915_00980 [Candidatus Yanofskybacteria bacterium RIFCSPLOWO2_01_FULL_41_34]
MTPSWQGYRFSMIPMLSRIAYYSLYVKPKTGKAHILGLFLDFCIGLKILFSPSSQNRQLVFAPKIQYKLVANPPAGKAGRTLSSSKSEFVSSFLAPHPERNPNPFPRKS